MRKSASLLLCCALILSGCAERPSEDQATNSDPEYFILSTQAAGPLKEQDKDVSALLSPSDGVQRVMESGPVYSANATRLGNHFLISDNNSIIEVDKHGKTIRKLPTDSGAILARATRSDDLKHAIFAYNKGSGARHTEYEILAINDKGSNSFTSHSSPVGLKACPDGSTHWIDEDKGRATLVAVDPKGVSSEIALPFDYSDAANMYLRCQSNVFAVVVLTAEGHLEKQTFTSEDENGVVLQSSVRVDSYGSDVPRGTGIVSSGVLSIKRNGEYSLINEAPDGYRTGIIDLEGDVVQSATFDGDRIHIAHLSDSNESNIKISTIDAEDLSVIEGPVEIQNSSFNDRTEVSDLVNSSNQISAVFPL